MMFVMYSSAREYHQQGLPQLKELQLQLQLLLLLLLLPPSLLLLQFPYQIRKESMSLFWRESWCWGCLGGY